MHVRVGIAALEDHGTQQEQRIGQILKMLLIVEPYQEQIPLPFRQGREPVQDLVGIAPARQLPDRFRVGGQVIGILCNVFGVQIHRVIQLLLGQQEGHLFQGFLSPEAGLIHHHIHNLGFLAGLDCVMDHLAADGIHQHGGTRCIQIKLPQERRIHGPLQKLVTKRKDHIFHGVHFGQIRLLDLSDPLQLLGLLCDLPLKGIIDLTVCHGQQQLDLPDGKVSRLQIFDLHKIDGLRFCVIPEPRPLIHPNRFQQIDFVVVAQSLDIAAAQGSEFFNGHHICNLLPPGVYH